MATLLSTNIASRITVLAIELLRAHRCDLDHHVPCSTMSRRRQVLVRMTSCWVARVIAT